MALQASLLNFTIWKMLNSFPSLWFSCSTAAPDTAATTGGGRPSASYLLSRLMK